MEALSKEAIVAAIAARKRDTVAVDVPEWGGVVLLRRLTAGDLETTGVMGSEADSPEVMRKVLAASICNENGDPLFSEADVAALNDADAIVTLKLFTECARVNGLMTDELEAMTEAFVEAQPDGSSTD